MTELKFKQMGCDETFCKFTFSNGRVEYGLIADFFERDVYYLVPLLQVGRFMSSQSADEKKEHCRLIFLKAILKAERIKSIKISQDGFDRLIIKKG